MVVAPSMIPRKSGDRQKSDKRDAAGLAILHGGGLLTAVWLSAVRFNHAAHQVILQDVRKAESPR